MVVLVEGRVHNITGSGGGTEAPSPSSSSSRSPEPSKRDSGRCREATQQVLAAATLWWQVTQPALTRPLHINRAIPGDKVCLHMTPFAFVFMFMFIFVYFFSRSKFLEVVPNPGVFTTTQV